MSNVGDKQKLMRWFYVFPGLVFAYALYLWSLEPQDYVVLFSGITTSAYLLFATYVIIQATLQARMIDVVFIAFIAIPALLNRYVTSLAEWRQLSPMLKGWPRSLEVAAPGWNLLLIAVLCLVALRFARRNSNG